MKPRKSASWWKTRFQAGRAFTLLFAAPGLLLVGVICLVQAENEGAAVFAAMGREDAQMNRMERLGAGTLEAEAAFRGFVLTRDATFLSRYFEARNGLLPALAEIEAHGIHQGNRDKVAQVRHAMESILEYHDVVSNAIFLQDSGHSLDELMRENKQCLERFDQALAELRKGSAARREWNAAAHEHAKNRWRGGQYAAMLMGVVAGCAGLCLLRRAVSDQPLCTLKLQGAARECAADMRARKAGARLNAILSAAAEVPIITTTPEGTINGFNPGAERVLGYPTNEALGLNLSSLVITPYALDGGQEQTDWICVRKDGSQVLLRARVSPIKDGKEEPAGYAVVGFDHTASARSQKLFEEFMRHTPVLSSLKDESGRILYMNEACAQMWRASAADATGRLEFELLPLEMAQKIRANDAVVFERGGSDSFMESYAVPGGEQRTFLSQRFRLELPGYGKLIGNASLDITERSLLERQLTGMKEELVSQTDRAWKTTRVKDAFLACMSHEIRTPVNAMTGMADLLWETNLDDEQRTFVRIFRSNADQLLHIINDILDLAKVESGEMRIASERLDLSSVVMETVELMRIGAHAKGLSLTASLPPDVPLGLLGDATRIRQILVNLVSNAIKFTDRGGVHINVRQEEEKPEFFRFEVADTGQGIPSGSEERIFHPFVQCDPSLVRRNAGAGLGLSICHRLTDLMGGTIGVESNPGTGSAFWFSVPLPCDPSLLAMTPGQEVRGVAQLSHLAGDRNQSVKVLLVDDLPDNDFLVRCLLRNEPVQLDSVCAGEEALAKVKETRYDLILMDLVMPGIDGHTATRLIREWEQEQGMPSTPIIALTAHALREEMEKSIAAGCDAHLTKPIRRPDLIEAIAKYARAGRRRPSAQILSQLRNIVPEFMERRRQDIETLRRALAGGDYPKISMVGHNLKGSGGGYGFQPISELGLQLEKSAAQNDDAEITRTIEALATYLQEVDVEYVTPPEEIPA